jgi:nuclear RNA export factor
MKGDSVIITASPEDIEQIAKLNNFMFAGATLIIKACEPISLPRGPKADERKEVSQTAQETKEKFRAILATRYDGNLKLLNLSALAQDAGLLQMGFGTFDGKTTSKLFPALMVVADQLFKSWQEKRDAIVSVSLANNNLSDVSAVTSLAQTFPDIKNLDLSSNNLNDLKSISSWRWKFRNLETLVLTANPIVTQMPGFNVEIMKWFPKLQSLNYVQVRNPEEIAAAIESVNTPIPISGPDFRDVSQVGENFVRQFVALYDTDRRALLSSFYDTESLHSIAVNMHAPRSREHTAPVPSWDAYTKHSRNLTKLTYAGPRLNRRYKGIQAIQAVWSELPPTRHPNLATEAVKYIIECHPLPGLADPSKQIPGGVDGLIITMHGEFEEQNKSTDKALRSFSRTFILGPGPPGGHPIRVVSDMMALRAWTPLAMPSQPPTIAPQAAPTSAEQQQKEAVAGQLMEKTGMTMQYAILCLEQTGWELPKAFEAFQQNKVRLL